MQNPPPENGSVPPLTEEVKERLALLDAAYKSGVPERIKLEWKIIEVQTPSFFGSNNEGVQTV